MLKKKNDKSIDYKKLNELLFISKNILSIIFVLVIFALILLFTYILKEWKIISILKTILKILSPFFIGIILAWLFDPIVTYLQKKGVKRILGTTFVFVVFIGFLVLTCFLMFPALINQINEIIVSMPNTLDNMTSWINNIFKRLSDIYSYDFSNIKTSIYDSCYNIFLSLTVDLPATFINIVKAIVSGGLNFIFGLFIAFYMLLDFNNVRTHLLMFLPKKIHGDMISITDRLNKTLKSYVSGTILIILLLFVFQSIGFSVAGLKAPMVFGLFCAVTNVIPYIGPYIGGIPAVVVGFTISPTVGLFTLIAVVVCQVLESYFLNPIVMSKTMKLHPVTIMISLLIFGHFFGILGMILATPIVSCGKMILSFFEEKYELLEKINK